MNRTTTPSGTTGQPPAILPTGSGIWVRELCKTYAGGIEALRGVSFEVRRGEVVGLTGLVGAGRTETARLLFGADPAEAGTVELDGLRAADKKCGRKMNIAIFTKDTDAFQAFASGHVEAYSTDLPVALYYVKQHPGAIRMAGKSFGSGGYYGIGISKSNPGLHAALVRAFQAIHRNGQYQRILKKWGLSSTAI